MGTWSEARFDIEFDGETPEELTHFTTLLEAFVEQREGPGAYLELYDFNWYRDGGMEFKMSSPRLPNMEWQIEQVVDFFRQYPHKPKEINVSVMEESDLSVFYDTEDLSQ